MSRNEIVKQMGMGGRLLITRLATTFQDYLLSCKVMNLTPQTWVEERFTELRVEGDGTKVWTLDGKLHNRNGPAVDNVHMRIWYLHGFYQDHEFLN